jgi:hypothetical protein
MAIPTSRKRRSGRQQEKRVAAAPGRTVLGDKDLQQKRDGA